MDPGSIYTDIGELNRHASFNSKLGDLDHVPDLVFSQPILTAEQVADAVLACVLDRRRERAMPRSTVLLARVAAAFPALQEMLRPMLEAKGARVKARLRAQR